MKTTKIMMILALLGGWAGGERKWYPAISGVSQHGIPKRWLIVLFHTEIANFGIIQEDSWFNHLTSMTSSLATQVHPVVVTFIHMGVSWLMGASPGHHWPTKMGDMNLQNGLIARHLIKNLGTYHWAGLKDLQEALAFAISFMKVSCIFSLQGIR